MPFYNTDILRRAATWIWVITLALAAAFIINFRAQLVLFWQYLAAEPEDVTAAMLEAQRVLQANFLAFLFIFILMLFISAPALLSVRTPLEIWRTAFHLLLHMLHLHGPAIFVNGGRVHATAEDLNRRGLGVLVVDFNSAVVLEEIIPPPTLWNMLLFFIDDILLFILGLNVPFQSPRVVGAGIYFTRRFERIRGAVDLRGQPGPAGERVTGVVDLRRQTRSMLNQLAYTRDGIELQTIIWSIFTIGQEPEVVEVTYAGQEAPENLRVVSMVAGSPGRFRVREIADTLLPTQRNEIHAWLQNSQNRALMAGQYAALHEVPLEPVYNPDRVFRAVITQARDSRDNQEVPLPWESLPVRLTLEALRTELIKWNYDQIVRQGGEMPVNRLRGIINNLMVSGSALSFRFVFHRSGAGLRPTDYPAGVLGVSPVVSFQANTPLRQRGIKIIAAGFTDLLPVSDAIYQQRLDSWRAVWEKETRVTTASHELEAMRVRSSAYQRTQDDIIRNLTRVMEENQFSREAQSINLLRALEAAAADPRTRQLVPDDVMNLMRQIHGWLLPKEPVTFTPQE